MATAVWWPFEEMIISLFIRQTPLGTDGVCTHNHKRAPRPASTCRPIAARVIRQLPDAHSTPSSRAPARSAPSADLEPALKAFLVCEPAHPDVHDEPKSS